MLVTWSWRHTLTISPGVVSELFHVVIGGACHCNSSYKEYFQSEGCEYTQMIPCDVEAVEATSDNMKPKPQESSTEDQSTSNSAEKIENLCQWILIRKKKDFLGYLLSLLKKIITAGVTTDRPPENFIDKKRFSFYWFPVSRIWELPIEKVLGVLGFF